MDIMMLSFEEPLIISVQGQTVKIVAFKTPEPGNIKFGIEAPRNIKVNREEVYLAIQQKIAEEKK